MFHSLFIPELMTFSLLLALAIMNNTAMNDRKEVSVKTLVFISFGPMSRHEIAGLYGVHLILQEIAKYPAKGLYVLHFQQRCGRLQVAPRPPQYLVVSVYLSYSDRCVVAHVIFTCTFFNDERCSTPVHVLLWRSSSLAK